MKLGDFLNTQAAKLGLQNDPALIALLSNSELANREIDDKFAIPLNEGLMSFDSAKNNFTLKNHFSATILNTVDAKLLENLDKLDLDEETIFKVRDEKSSYNKIQIIKDAIGANIEKLKTSVDSESKTRKSEMEKQIRDLNDQLFNLKTQYTQEKADRESKYNDEIKDFLFTNYLASKNYANKEYSTDENSAFARMLIDKAMKENGIITVKDGDKLALKNASSPDLEYFDKDGKKVSFSDFADNVLASKKVLAVSEPGDGIKPPNTPPAQQVTIPVFGGNKTMFDTALQQSLGDIK